VPETGPAIILVDPQLGENVGMVARAMLNCGLGDLRLVRPRDGWPNTWAEKAASGAGEVLAKVRLFDSTAEAMADLQRLFAATARTRDLAKPILTPRRAAAEIHAAQGRAEAVGVMFGPERSGLISDDVALADGVIQVPLNPAFTSLNLAQAVLLVGYEWFQARSQTPPSTLPPGTSRRATKAELAGFFARLEAALDEGGFLLPVEKRPTMVRNLRTFLTRAEPTEQEVRTLHGVLSTLAGKKRAPRS